MPDDTEDQLNLVDEIATLMENDPEVGVAILQRLGLAGEPGDTEEEPTEAPAPVPDEPPALPAPEPVKAAEVKPSPQPVAPPAAPKAPAVDADTLKAMVEARRRAGALEQRMQEMGSRLQQSSEAARSMLLDQQMEELGRAYPSAREQFGGVLPEDFGSIRDQVKQAYSDLQEGKVSPVQMAYERALWKHALSGGTPLRDRLVPEQPAPQTQGFKPDKPLNTTADRMAALRELYQTLR